MDYRIEENNNLATIYLEGELDMAVGSKVDELIRQVGERNQKIQLDFQEVTFVDSSGIGSLFYATKDLLNAGKTMEIVNVQEEILDILEVLGFAEALGIEVKSVKAELGFEI